MADATRIIEGVVMTYERVIRAIGQTDRKAKVDLLEELTDNRTANLHRFSPERDLNAVITDAFLSRHSGEKS